MNVREPETNEGRVPLIYFVCLFVFPFTCLDSPIKSNANLQKFTCLRSLLAFQTCFDSCMHGYLVRAGVKKKEKKKKNSYAMSALKELCHEI